MSPRRGQKDLTGIVADLVEVGLGNDPALTPAQKRHALQRRALTDGGGTPGVTGNGAGAAAAPTGVGHS